MNIISAPDASALFYFAFWVFGLWVLFVAWRSYQVDHLRQELFALRDELFDFAMLHRDQLGFGAPAYSHLRSTINTMIRFAHMVNASRLVFPLLRRNSPERQLTHYERWRTDVNQLASDEAKRQLKELEHRMGILLAKHMLCTSPTALPIFLLLMLRSRRKVDTNPRQALLDEGAEQARLLEEQAIFSDELQALPRAVVA